MKRILSILIAVSLVMVFAGSVMAVDLEAAKQTISEMKSDLNEMYEIINTARRGKYQAPNANLADKAFTATQKQTLVDRYQALKLQLQASFADLP